jgi:hypothetical protein
MPVVGVVDLFGGGLVVWLIFLLSHIFLGFKEDGTILRHVIHISLVIHAIQRSILKLTPVSHAVCIAASRL